MTCPECGTEMAGSARFCHECGWDSKLAAAGPAASTAGERPAWKRRTMSAILGFASLLVLWLLLTPRSDAEASLVPGMQAPDFRLEALDGSVVALSELRGRPVVVNFWASWCTPCRKEMPDFEEVYTRYREAGLAVYGINVGESRVAVSSFRDRTGVTFPLLLDREELAQTAYRILPLPATFFVDRDGVIRAVYQYQMSKAQIEAEVQRLLAR